MDRLTVYDPLIQLQGVRFCSVLLVSAQAVRPYMGMAGGISGQKGLPAELFAIMPYSGLYAHVAIFSRPIHANYC
jgi:hypothetical protein